MNLEYGNETDGSIEQSTVFWSPRWQKLEAATQQ